MNLTVNVDGGSFAALLMFFCIVLIYWNALRNGH